LNAVEEGFSRYAMAAKVIPAPMDTMPEMEPRSTVFFHCLAYADCYQYGNRRTMSFLWVGWRTARGAGASKMAGTNINVAAAVSPAMKAVAVMPIAWMARIAVVVNS